MAFGGGHPKTERNSLKSSLLKAIAVPAVAALVWGCSLQNAAAAPSVSEYVVKPGDNLWTIACLHQTTVNTILKTNGLQSIMIFPGQTLSIPNSSTDADEPAASEEEAPKAEIAQDAEYVVQSGDTLSKIALQHGVPVSAIKSANGLTSDALFIGETLIIPTGPARQAVTVSRSGNRAQVILDYAATHLGTPYRSGGSTPGGFDCSGFTSHVFGKFGISIPRTSQDQFRAGTKIDRSQLRPGDLVFFTTYAPGASHVGIYTGNNRFIHSSSPRSGGVIYTSMGESYYAQRYLGARRILP